MLLNDETTPADEKDLEFELWLIDRKVPPKLPQRDMDLLSDARTAFYAGRLIMLRRTRISKRKFAFEIFVNEMPLK